MKIFLSKLTEERALISFLTIPLYFLARYIVKDYLGIYPFSWEELITLTMMFGASIILLCFFLHGKEKLQGIVVSLSIFILFLNDLLGNEIDNGLYHISLWIIFILIGVFFIVELFSVIKIENVNYNLVEEIIFLIIFTSGFIISLYFIESVVFDFGSQWVWVSIVPLSALFFLLSIMTDNVTFNSLSEKEEEVLKIVLGILSFLMIFVGIISTLYQFWFSEIVFGYNLWQTLLIIIIAILTFFTVFFSVRFFIKKRNKKLARIKADKERSEQKRKQEEMRIKKEEERSKLLKEIAPLTNMERDHLYRAVKYLDVTNDYDRDEILSIIVHLDLTKLFVVSAGHQKIFWNKMMPISFDLIYKTMMSITNDNVLLKIANRIIDLFEYLEKFRKFEGYDILMSGRYAEYNGLINSIDKAKVFLVNFQIFEEKK